MIELIISQMILNFAGIYFNNIIAEIILLVFILDK